MEKWRIQTMVRLPQDEPKQEDTTTAWARESPGGGGGPRAHLVRAGPGRGFRVGAGPTEQKAAQWS